MIMELRGYNTKHYCIYYDIRGYFNGKHIYCPLQSAKDISESTLPFGNTRNYVASQLPLRSHQEDYENAVYLRNYKDLEFNRITGIKGYNLFWNLESLNWQCYIHK